MSKKNLRLSIFLIFLSIVFISSFVEAQTNTANSYSDCSVYGNCFPINQRNTVNNFFNVTNQTINNFINNDTGPFTNTSTEIRRKDGYPRSVNISDALYTNENRTGIRNNAPDFTGTSLDQFIVGDGTQSQGMVIYTSGSSDGAITFMDALTSVEGRILYRHSDNSMRYFANNVEVMSMTNNRINMSKNVTVNDRLGINISNPSVELQVEGRSIFGHFNYTQAPVVIRGGQTGTPMLTLSRRAGVVADFSLLLASGGLTISDDTNGVNVVNILGDNNQNQLYIGQRGKISNDSRTAVLSANSFSSSVGNNINGQELRIRGGTGTGAGIPGNITIFTGNPGASGSTEQSAALRATINGSGFVIEQSLIAKMKIESENTTIKEMLELKSITLPICDTGNDGKVGRNGTGIFYCNSTNWRMFQLE